MKHILGTYDAILRPVHGVKNRAVDEILLIQRDGIARIEICPLAAWPMALGTIRVNVGSGASLQGQSDVGNIVCLRITGDLGFIESRREDSEMSQRAQLVIRAAGR